MFLKIRSVKKTFKGNHCVADNTSLTLEKGELGALLGPSGCGKTTLLRMIAGFERPDFGKIELDGKTLSSTDTFIGPEKRSVGLVFQDYALFPHMSVYENISFGIKSRKKKQIRETVETLLELTNLTHTAKKYPHEISGGQQQRVALARAIAPEPSLLLLDEPFSSLDVSLRESLSMEVRNVLKTMGITALMVTHNQQEAFSLADKTGIMMNGKILQWDKADTLYYRPENKKVACFIGEGRFVKGTVTSENSIKTELGVIEGISVNGTVLKREVDVFIRPEDVSFNQTSCLRAKVLSGSFRGPEMFYTLSLPSGTLIHASTRSENGIIPGNDYGIALNLENVIVFEH